MDEETARIGAQELSNEIPKGVPDVIEKTTGAQKIAPLKDGEGHDVEAAQTEEFNPPQVKVPRSKRRGLFGRFTIIAEVEEPKRYPRKTKWFITFVVAMAAMAAPLGSAIIFRMFLG